MSELLDRKEKRKTYWASGLGMGQHHIGGTPANFHVEE
jgi:hypothetical protein